MPRKPTPDRPDSTSPELDEAWFQRARPASELLPGLVGADTAAALLQPRRGRPPLESSKQHVNIRLDADVLAAFKARGSGWQTRVNEALKEWLKTHQGG